MLFDYYIFVDYSDYLIGYVIIKSEKIPTIRPKVRKLKHYRELKNKKGYLQSIKKLIKKVELIKDLEDFKSSPKREKISRYIELKKFIHRHKKCKIFTSVDNNEFSFFKKFLAKETVNVVIVKESTLKKGSVEYQLSLICDTMLNIKRKK